MGKILEILQWAIANGPNLVTAIVAVISALIALFLLIPGDQPEKTLQSVVDFLKKFSLKGS